MVKLIVGLGNIGRKYRHTRHNVGFAAISGVAGKCGKRLRKGFGIYGCTPINFNEDSAWLIRPRTYMNNSGIAVSKAANKYNLNPDEILIIYDDIYLPLGAIRIRPQGSDGGHNGLASVINHMGTKEIPRLRIGVGPCPETKDSAEYVLSRFLPNELEIIEKVLGKAADAVLYLLSHRLDEAMGKYNINPASDSRKDN